MYAVRINDLYQMDKRRQGRFSVKNNKLYKQTFTK